MELSQIVKFDFIYWHTSYYDNIPIK